MEEKSDIFKHYWYNLKVVQYEVAKQCQGREVVFLDKSHTGFCYRCIFLTRHEQLINSFKRFAFFKYDYNIYCSVAHFKDTPLFDYNFAERQKQTDAFSGKGQSPTYPNYWNGYDFFMDFDSNSENDLMPALEDCHSVKDMLDHYQVPYHLTFSGSKGFHLRIPYSVMPQTLGLNIVTFCKIMAENIKERLKLDTLDIGVFDERRIFKTPYSYDRGNICLPLTEEQFQNFDVKEMAARNVVNNVKIFNRGLLTRHLDRPLEAQRESFRQFWTEFR